MSILTWRDVATPDLSGAAYAQAQAQKAMNDAFAAANGTINGIKGQRADVADRNIINRALQYQTPEQLQAAIADGSLVGSDGQYAHVDTLKDLPSRVDAMLKNSLTQAQVGQIDANTQHQQFTNTSEAERKANIDANAPIITNAQVLAANGKYTEAVAALKNSTLKPEVQQAILADLNNNTTNADSILKTQFDFAKTQKDQADSYAADQAYKDVMASSTNAPTARAAMLEKIKTLNPEAGQALVAKLKTQYPDIEANPLKDLNLTTEPIPGAGVSDLTQYGRKYGDSQFAYGKDGFDPTTHSIADVQKYQRDVMIPTNRGKIGSDDKTKGSGAIGAYQQTYETIQRLAPKVFPGQDLSKIQFTPQVQDKLAEAQFNEAKADPKADLKAIWPSLTTQEAAQLKNMTWAEAAPYIMAGESGTGKTAAAVTLAMQNRLKVFDTTNTLNKQIADQSANGFIKGYYDAANDATNANNPGAVAAQLAGRRNELAKADVGNITAYISDIMKQANVTAPVAGLILENSLEKTNWHTGGFVDRHLNFDGITGAALGGGFEVNRDSLQNFIKMANNPEIKQSASDLNYHKELVNTLTDANNRLSAAATELQKVSAAQRADPNNPQLNAALQQATKVYTDAYLAVNGIQNNTLNTDAQRQAQAEQDKKAAAAAATKRQQAILESATRPPVRF